jgi:hypothetical protein
MQEIQEAITTILSPQERNESTYNNDDIPNLFFKKKILTPASKALILQTRSTAHPGRYEQADHVRR